MFLGMKRNFAIIFFALLLVCEGYSQSSESWINYSQAYYKIPVGQDGIYRLTYANLQQAGFPVDAVEPTLMQLFHRGVEQAIYVEGEGDFSFDVADFIEFFGQRNDGMLDANLYEAGKQPHRYYNLFSDTTSYFLTIGSAAGKRMPLLAEGNSDNRPAAGFVDNEILLVAKDQYSIGTNINQEVSSSSFGEGEGWMGVQVVQGGQADYMLEGIDLREISAHNPVLEIALTGRSVFPHNAEIYIGSTFRLLKSITFSPFETIRITEEVDWSDITSDGKLKLRIKAVNGGFANYLSLAYAKIVYPQKTDAALKSSNQFYIPENPAGKTYIEIANASANYRLFDVTDQNAVIRLGTTITSTVNAIVPFSGRRKILGTSVTLSPQIVRSTFRPITSGEHDFVIVTHPDLRVPAGEYADPVKAYAEYRASAEGGSYDTILVNMPMLYDQFSYGEITPLAIINFLRYLSQDDVTPDYLFLVGKGVDIWYKYHRGPSGGYRDLVPTSGYPGSDANFSAGIGGSGVANAISTGRLSVTNAAQIAAYLNKVREMESTPGDVLWKKNILHLSGGIEPGEPETFKSILEEFGAIAEGPYLGGKVEAIAKQSRDIQVINIADQVNRGVGLVTFFGHSSPETLDFDIGYASDEEMGYNNKGKYPALLMNGCEAGAFFLKGYLFGEDWINTADKGASAFIAHSGYGLVPALRKYSTLFYEVGYGDSLFIDKGIGDIQRETARRFIEENGSEMVEQSQVQQMILLGDPSVKLFGVSKPDLEINSDNASVKSLNGDPVTVMSDSFAIELVVRNFGLASKKSFRIEATRTFGDNTTLVYDSIFKMPSYSDTLTFIIRQQGGVGAGNNSFRIVLDPDEFIEETNESNNEVEINYLFPANGTKNLFPRAYSIVNDQELKLSFQATDVFSGSRNFVVDFDTVLTFNSAFRQSFNTTGDVYAVVPVSLLPADTMTYFWRTRLADPLPDESVEWDVSSFTFIQNGEDGWAQIQFSQLLENPSVGLVLDQGVRRIRFQETKTPVEVLTFGASAGKPRDSVSVKIDGQEYNLYTQAGGGFGCRDNTINLIAFDKNSTVPYVGIYFKWYEILFTYGGRRLVCGREPFVINSFTSNEVNTGTNDDLIYYIDQIADGDSVLLYNIGDAGVNAWSAAARAKVAELGISETQLSQILPGAPFVIFAKKGTAAGAAKMFSTSEVPATSGRLEVRESVTGGFSSGILTTTTIGPALEWNKLVWKVREIESDDIVSFDVQGIKLTGETTMLLTNAAGDHDLSSIDAGEYPYLRVQLHVTDDLLLTPAQLRNWMVLYTPAPEGLLLPVSRQLRYELDEGQVWSERFRFINISDKEFADSLSVNVTTFNQEKHSTTASEFRIIQPAPGDTTLFSVNVNTLGAGGSNDVTLRVNPRILPEQYYDNNVLQRPDYIFVRQDDRAPVLSVSVDGRTLVNHDYVSSNPLIEISLRDENSFVFKKDTLGMRIFLSYPCDLQPCTPSYIPLSSDQIEWTPATATSDFRIVWRPHSLPPGEYLLKVEGADANAIALSSPYLISFVVNEENGLIFISPYPNPVADNVSYGFVATGDDVPVEMTFSIIDVTGQMVSTQRSEGNDFHTGTNIQLRSVQNSGGNALPPGIYIYVVSVKTASKTVVVKGKLVVKN